MEKRMYKCEIPGCDREVAVRSTIKSGEHEGKKACTICKNTIDKKTTSRTPLKRFKPKTKEKRKAERVGLPKFFDDAIEELKRNPVCVNCGCKINANYNPHWNIAHILPKSKYKSVMTHPENFIILCSSKDQENGIDCHTRFDNNIMDIPSMPCFPMAKEKFEKFKPDCLERGKIFTIFEQN